MSIIGFSPEWGYDIDLSTLVKNWVEDKTGAQRRQINQAGVLSLLARKCNHLLGVSAMRPIFTHLETEASMHSSSGAQNKDCNVATGYNDNVDNARTWVLRVLALPKSSSTYAAFDCYVGMAAKSAYSAKYNAIISSPRYPEDLFIIEMEIDRGSVTDAHQALEVNAYGGFTILDFVLEEKPLEKLDTDIHLYVNPNLPASGQIILADILEDIRSAFWEIRNNNSPTVLEWHAQADGGSYSESASAPGNQYGMIVESATYVNLIDQNYTTRTATSPGVFVPVRYFGWGLESAAATSQEVAVRFKVFGKLSTPGTGDDYGSYDAYVMFQGPLGSTTCSITAQGWHSSSGAIYLDPTKSDSESTTARNKIDIFGKTSGIKLAIWIIYGYLCRS